MAFLGCDADSSESRPMPCWGGEEIPVDQGPQNRCTDPSSTVDDRASSRIAAGSCARGAHLRGVKAQYYLTALKASRGSTLPLAAGALHLFFGGGHRVAVVPYMAAWPMEIEALWPPQPSLAPSSLPPTPKKASQTALGTMLVV